MHVYVGQTRSKRLIHQLEQLGFGECTLRGRLPPRRTRFGWFYDNGAFADCGRGFESAAGDQPMK
jgi:hypothetical protein